MLIYTKIAELQAFLTLKRKEGLSFGFVPTMGALHQGHISLIDISRKHCNLTICSIFVNPTQFNDKADLERYPRTPEKDIEMLEMAQCDVLFMPDVNEMYPEQDDTRFDFGQLGNILEGEHRPGHFNGVAQVVKRLFNIVGPDKAFFGSKDYQQVMVVKELVRQMKSAIEIVSCPILREPDGLAMSSRNTLLNPSDRKIAAQIPVIMREAREVLKAEGITPAKNWVKSRISQHPEMRLDYYEVCNPENLSVLSGSGVADPTISLIAVFVGKVRLIDNLI